MRRRSAVILFVKSPEKGKVKSRLASAIGAVRASELYTAFILDAVKTLRAGGYRLVVAFYPETSRETVIGLLGSDLEFISQRGKDLGERMKNAFDDVFAEGVRRAVLVGSDIPDLACGTMREAFGALTKKDMVIGPAVDGGYFLVGFRMTTFLPGIFSGIPWGSDSVFRETMKKVRKAGHDAHILPVWRDVDTLEDLRSLFTRNMDTVFRHSLTMSCCERLFGCGSGEPDGLPSADRRKSLRKKND